ncbi:paraquat-inducible protein A [Bdellovibrio sp. SKB1291214]|uniref:paraquat-inducible protein A n=1 Tax=Bdellovibrio sp. SKB1291214 TaxID=1732569 RepID=UPI000B5150EF|nr:paraquat-inducible protein A [Bdellovibrio sp. SKB1291214]UYL07257.1 paraquat-inducible protein A [Bdellovibrio sp. SKB1291214]
MSSVSQDHCKICGAPLGDEGTARFVVCEKCGTINQVAKNASAHVSLACSLTALILYLPANMLPFMTLEVYGNKNTATIWGGIVTLSEGGAWGIAMVVFLASIVVPVVKLIILFYLGLTANTSGQERFKTRLYNFVEAIGRWSMLDIFLLAVLVAIMKMGPWAHAEPGAGAWMFALVVIFTMLSSAYFDPSTIWKNSQDEKL